MRMRRLISITIALCTMLAVMASGMTVFGAQETSGNAADDSGQSSFTYKKYSSHDDYFRALKYKMRTVSVGIAEHVDLDNIIPIPGLVKTCITSKGEETSATSYVPQGICSAGKYWLITAYDSGKKLKTVIYIVDTESKELVSTVGVPNRYHAGGIAFDGENVWMTGDTSDKYKGNPFVQYIRWSDIEEKMSEPVCSISKKEISEPVYIKNKPSFLEYDDGVLWVGTYIGRKGTAEGYLNGYTIIREEDGAKLNTTIYSSIQGIDASAQGADIEGNKLFVSSSYKGTVSDVRSSFVTKYDISPIKKKGQAVLLVKKRQEMRVEVPKMNEEIIVDKDNIYINFESASEEWKRSVINTDRILAIKRSVWG